MAIKARAQSGTHVCALALLNYSLYLMNASVKPAALIFLSMVSAFALTENAPSWTR